MKPLTFDRKIGMYGNCKTINGRIGLAGEVFARADFDAMKQDWGIAVYNIDGTVTEYTVPAAHSMDQAIDQVEAIMSLAYRSNYASARAA